MTRKRAAITGTKNVGTGLVRELKPFSRIAVAQRVRHTALSVEGVVTVGSNSPMQVATYGMPGETVRGIRVTASENHLELEVHVVARLVPLHSLAERIRSAVRETVSEWDDFPLINVYIDDLDESP